MGSDYPNDQSSFRLKEAKIKIVKRAVYGESSFHH
jgi:hypothetical protein